MRILLIEDDDTVRDSLGRGLREHGFAVDSAANGSEGLEMALLECPDVIILDLMLPGMGGLEICKRLREAGSSAGILMLTARRSIDDRVLGLDAGADDYLPKPFAFAELMARVRALGRRATQERGVEVVVGPLTVDRVRRRASRSGRELPLTAKEFAILEYLALHSGRTIGRAELSEHVWDSSFDGFSRALDVHINRLRRKLDPPGAPQLLRTRRGEGYVLEAEPAANATTRVML